MTTKKKLTWFLICGLLGSFMMAGSDWMMIYGDMTFHGNLAWLTEGVAEIEPWRNAAALGLSFPAVIFYSIALFGVRSLLKEEKDRKVYGGLTVAGMTPWLCLHLFYIMILFLFAWMMKQGENGLAYEACEALFAQFSWVVIVGEALILLPFLYLFYLMIKKRSVFSKWMCLNNPLLIYLILKVLTGFIPEMPWKLAFINGLMSESMIIFFIVLFGCGIRKGQNKC